jgi:hypothetical protein
MRNQPPKRRGRPKLAEPAIVYRLALTLRPGEDDDLIAFFDAVPLRGRPAALKQALRGNGFLSSASSYLSDEHLADALEQFLA